MNYNFNIHLERRSGNHHNPTNKQLGEEENDIQPAWSHHQNWLENFVLKICYVIHKPYFNKQLGKQENDIQFQHSTRGSFKEYKLFAYV